MMRPCRQGAQLSFRTIAARHRHDFRDLESGDLTAPFPQSPRAAAGESRRYDVPQPGWLCVFWYCYRGGGMAVLI